MAESNARADVAEWGTIALVACVILGAVLGWVARTDGHYNWVVTSVFAAAGIISWSVFTAVSHLMPQQASPRPDRVPQER